MSKNLKVSKNYSGILKELIEHQDVLSFWFTWFSFDDLKNLRLINKNIQMYINESCTSLCVHIWIESDTDLSRLWSQLSIFWSKFWRLEKTDLMFNDEYKCLSKIIFPNPNLHKLSSLRYLYLENTGVEDISSLINCSNLKFLDISGTLIKDLSALSHLKKIETLEANETSLENLDSLRGCPLLEIELISCNDLKNVMGLNECPNLVSIDLTGSEQVSTFWDSGTLLKIKKLDLSDTGLSDFSSLITNWELLVSLSLSFTNVKDIKSLHQAINLKYLGLDGLKLTTIASLGTCKNIEYLSIGYNEPIISIETIEKFKNLRVLRIFGTEGILGIRSILKCQLLEVLYIDEEPHQEIEDSLSSEIDIYIYSR